MKMRCRQFYRAGLVVVFLAIGLVLVALVLPITQLILPEGLSDTLNGKVVVYWNRLICKVLNIRLQTSGSPRIRSGLMVSNHISWLDIVVLGQLHPLYFIAKSEILDWPIIGFLGRGIGTLFLCRSNRRQARATAERMIWQLRHRKQIVVFPEGTTTNGDGLLRFHTMLFNPPILAGTAVQAVAIRYLGAARAKAPFIGDDAFIPHLIQILGLKQIDVSIAFSPALNPSRYSRTELARRTHEQLLSHLTESGDGQLDASSNIHRIVTATSC